jgi:hypothetical protein
MSHVYEDGAIHLFNYSCRSRFRCEVVSDRNVKTEQVLYVKVRPFPNLYSTFQLSYTSSFTRTFGRRNFRISERVWPCLLLQASKRRGLSNEENIRGKFHVLL